MEGEVKEIQMELAAIRKDRLDLHNRKHIDIVSNIFFIVSNSAYVRFYKSVYKLFLLLPMDEIKLIKIIVWTQTRASKSNSAPYKKDRPGKYCHITCFYRQAVM